MEVIKIEEYRKHKRPKKKPKNFVPAIYLLLLTVGIYFFIHSSFFYIQKINIAGNELLEREKILTLSQVEIGQNLIRINKNKIIENVSVHPLIKKVDIKKSLPTTLKIIIEERKPIGLVVCPDGFIQVSEDGYFLALMQDLGHYNLPVISGLNIEQLPGPGQKIENLGLYNALAILKEGEQKFLENIVELNIANEKHILAYTVEGIEIKLGTLENMPRKLADLNQIIEDIVNKEVSENSIEYIDLRFFGPPVIKKK